MKKKIFVKLFITFLTIIAIPMLGFLHKKQKSNKKTENPNLKFDRLNNFNVIKNKINIHDGCAQNTAKTSKNENILNTKVTIKNKKNEIVEATLEEYLTGVIAAEISPNYETEAIKAQFIAAHTYALNSCGENGPYPADPNTFQAYIDKEERKKKYKEKFEEYENKLKYILKEVANKIITFDGKPIKATFHAMSNGKTQNCEDVWTTKIPYLVSTDSSAETKLQNFETKIVKKISEVFNTVKSKYPNVKMPSNENEIIKILSKTKAGYVKNVKIFDAEIAAKNLREILKLPSTSFETKTENDNIIFICKGKGHGVGMSQCGANELAKQGKYHEEILKHFYPGINFKLI